MKVYHKSNVKYEGGIGAEYIVIFPEFDIEIKYIPKKTSNVILIKAEWARVREDYLYNHDYSEYDDRLIVLRSKEMISLLLGADMVKI